MIGQAAEQFFHVIQHFARLHVAHNHQRGVVRCIPGAVPLAQIFRLERVQIRLIADNRRTVFRLGIGIQINLLPHFAVGVVIRGEAALFADYLHFVFKIGIAEIQVHHAVGLQLQHLRQAAHGKFLVIHGFVARSEGVVAAAQRRNAAAEFAGGHGGRAFKHHVLQGMAQASFACVLVGTAHLKPQLRNRHRRAVVFTHNHFHTIGQHARLRFCRRRHHRGRQHGGHKQ